MIEVAIARGRHVPTLVLEGIQQLSIEDTDKVGKRQAHMVEWAKLKEARVPAELNISPIAMIPHKLRQYRAILAYPLGVKLVNGTKVTSVNAITIVEV
jgi:hypothetical protein